MAVLSMAGLAGRSGTEPAGAVTDVDTAGRTTDFGTIGGLAGGAATVGEVVVWWGRTRSDAADADTGIGFDGGTGGGAGGGLRPYGRLGSRRPWTTLRTTTAATVPRRRTMGMPFVSSSRVSGRATPPICILGAAPRYPLRRRTVELQSHWVATGRARLGSKSRQTGRRKSARGCRGRSRRRRVLLRNPYRHAASQSSSFCAVGTPIPAAAQPTVPPGSGDPDVRTHRSRPARRPRSACKCRTRAGSLNSPHALGVPWPALQSAGTSVAQPSTEFSKASCATRSHWLQRLMRKCWQLGLIRITRSERSRQQ